MPTLHLNYDQIVVLAEFSDPIKVHTKEGRFLTSIGHEATFCFEVPHLNETYSPEIIATTEDSAVLRENNLTIYLDGIY